MVAMAVFEIVLVPEGVKGRVVAMAVFEMVLVAEGVKGNVGNIVEKGDGLRVKLKLFEIGRASCRER